MAKKSFFKDRLSLMKFLNSHDSSLTGILRQCCDDEIPFYFFSFAYLVKALPYDHHIPMALFQSTAFKLINDDSIKVWFKSKIK